MANTPGSERRNFVRISTDLPVRLMAPCSAAFACDMSTGGVGVIVRDTFPRSIQDIAGTHDQVKIEIDLPSGQTVSVAAEIAWGRMDKEDGAQAFRLGLRFVDVPPAIQKLIDSYLKEKALQLAFPDSTGAGSGTDE
jgi:c-di-GMP-binding flagellar brake protein YcgR